MPENILVVEYEPRYAERVRQALAGQPIQAWYAKDGEEAMRALDSHHPKLIVLSSVVPKISAPDLIRVIRGRGQTQKTPILLTVSGYTGTSPKHDAARMGASDILPKPFSESEFLGKVHELLGVGQLTSSQIFGDILDESATATPKRSINPTDNVDKLLEQTLAGVMKKREDLGLTKKTTSGGTTLLDKKLQDTLSGLERSARKPTPAPQPVPKTPPPPRVDDVPIPQPVFPETPVAKEEEEPSDGIRFGQYVLLEKIATGGMAEVWKARMKGVEGFQKIVAIKKILPHLSDNQDFIEMFVNEAKLAAQLNHNNIIHIYDLGKIASSYYIAMEYVDGHDLKNILKRAHERDQPMQVEVALFVATKIAAALDYAHRKRDFDQKEMELVHRDVSPQNVLISQEGDIKLCDFGIAKAASKASHTQVGALKGKLQYMSPEQASGKAIDRRSDIFALGAVLFEMLTGRKLFAGENEMSILEQVREGRVIPPSQISEEITPNIDRVVLKALQKDVAARYQTAGELARDLDAILYDFKPQPTSADLAIYMHRIWSDAPAMPKLEEGPDPFAVATERDENELVAAPAAVVSPPPPIRGPVTAPGGVVMPAWDAPAPRSARGKRSAVVPLGVAAVLVAGIVGAFFYVRGRNGAAASPAQQPIVNQAASTPAPAPVTSTTPVTETTTTTAPAMDTAAAAPVLDPALINQEVQKRLAAERARLEQQARAQQTPPPLTASAIPPALQQSTPPVVTQTVAPQPPPVQQTQTVAPPPVTEPAVTQTQPAPAQASDTAAANVVREGDLVPAGTEGLVPARVIRRATVPYPPLARAQRVEGTVVMSVLVSETGQVLDVRVLRGVSKSVGLNEAATMIMRRSTFSAPTKDGVRVKAWTTVPVEFKL